MKRPAVLLAVLVAVALVVYGLGRYDAVVNARDAAHQSRIDEALRTAKPFHARQDSLQAAARADSLRIAQLEAQVRPLQAANTALRRQIELHRPTGVVPVAVVDSIVAVAEARDVLRVETISRIWELVAIERTRADSALARVVVLESIIEQDPGRCRFLILLPCPSRTTAFVGGALVGAVAVSLANR